MGEEKEKEKEKQKPEELEVKKHDDRIYDTVLGVLLIILAILYFLWQNNKGAVLYISPPLVFEFNVAVYGYGIFFFIFAILLYRKRMSQRDEISQLLTSTLYTGVLLGCSWCCFTTIMFVSFDNSRVSNLAQYDSLNYQNHRYHLNSQPDDVYSGTIDRPPQFIIWECDKSGIICRQIDILRSSEAPVRWYSDTVQAQFEVDPETDQLIVVVNDQRFVVENVGR